MSLYYQQVNQPFAISFVFSCHLEVDKVSANRLTNSSEFPGGLTKVPVVLKPTNHIGAFEMCNSCLQYTSDGQWVVRAV